MKQQDRVVLTVEEVADRLLLNPRTVYRMIDQGELHAVRAGRLWRIPKESLARYLKGKD